MSRPSPQPFRLNIPDEALQDLRERLTRVRWPDEAAADRENAAARMVRS